MAVEKRIARIGPDTWFFKIRQWWLNRKARRMFDYFGEGSEFRPDAYAVHTQNISIGKRVVIRPGCRLYADDRTFIIIKDDVLLAHGVHMYTNNHSFNRMDIPIAEQGYEGGENIVLERGCWIGANSVILSGVTVGRNAVVGAGSVVTRDVPAGEVWCGNPARRIKRRQENVQRKKDTSDSPGEGRKLYARKKHTTV